MRVKCLILVLLVLIFAFQPGTADAAVSQKFENYQSFLMELGILEKDITETSVSVTRGEFVQLAMRAQNYVLGGECDNSFSDVSASHMYSSAIYGAKSMGIISGAESKFRPDSFVTYDEALKILLTSLGYEREADVSGGYPLGYNIIANRIGLDINVSAGSEYLTYKNVLEILYNFVTCDICEVVSIDGENVTTQRQLGKTLLSERFGLACISGVVKSAGFMSMEQDFFTEKPQINISGVVFKTNIETPEDYLGLYADGYYDKETNILKAIYAKNQNSVVALDIKEIVQYKDFTLYLLSEDGKRETTYKMSKGFTLVKNGRIVDIPVEDNFMFESGELKLIDNNADGMYDVALTKQVEYMVVTSLNKTTGGIFDNNVQKEVYLDNTGGNAYKIYSANGEGSFADISIGMILSVCESADKMYKEIYISNDKIKGTIEEISGDTLKISGEEYRVSSYFADNFSVSPGTEATFSLGFDKSIVGMNISSDNIMQYGYLCGAYRDTNGLADKVLVCLLETSGKYLEGEIAERVILNGKAKKPSDTDVVNAIFNGNYPRYQLIRYSLNAEGKISKIDIAQPCAETDTTEKYKDTRSEDDSLTIFVNNKKSYFHRSYGVFMPYAVVGNNTTIIKVPLCIAENQEEAGRLKIYDRKNFNVVSQSDLVSYGSYDVIDIYDLSMGLEPGVIIIYEGVPDAVMTPDESTGSILVDKVTLAIDEDGVLTKKITAWQDGNFETFMLSSQLAEHLEKEGKLPSAGDVVRLAISPSGEIAGLDIDVSYSAADGKITINNVTSTQNGYTFFRGKLFAKGGASLAVKVESGPMSAATGYDAPLDGLTAFKVTNSTKYVQFDKRNNIIRHISADELCDIVSAGEDGASEVVISAYYNSARLVVVYSE